MDAASGPINKNRKTDIQFILRPKQGKAGGKAVYGSVDSRLFNGGNTLHAVMDTQTCLWSLKYDSGTIPEAFKQRFTGYTKLLNFVRDYYARRDVEIVDIID